MTRGMEMMVGRVARKRRCFIPSVLKSTFPSIIYFEASIAS